MQTSPPVRRFTTFQTTALKCGLHINFTLMLRPNWPNSFEKIKLALEATGLPEEQVAVRIATDIEKLRTANQPRYQVNYSRGKGFKAMKDLVALNPEDAEAACKWMIKYGRYFLDPDWLILQDWSECNWEQILAIRLMFGSDPFTNSVCSVIAASISPAETAQTVTHLGQQNADLFFTLADGDEAHFEDLMTKSIAFSKLRAELIKINLKKRTLIENNPEKE